MTLEEVLIQFEKHSLCDSLGFSDEDDVTATELAVTTIKNAIKYRWHDIVSNPRDLPKRDLLVEVKFANGNYNHAIYDWYDECFGYRNVSRIDLRSEVIAWREIEPIVGE